jgi:hypothetical protein
MPPKAKRVAQGKRYPLNMRTTQELREKMEAAARMSGRSLVQEVEYRLERSFHEDGLLGDPTAARAYHGLAFTIATLKSRHGPTWLQTPDIARELAQGLLNALSDALGSRLAHVTISIADHSDPLEWDAKQIGQNRLVRSLAEIQRRGDDSGQHS